MYCCKIKIHKAKHIYFGIGLAEPEYTSGEGEDMHNKQNRCIFYHDSSYKMDGTF